MPEVYESVATSPAGRVRSLSVNQSFNQENSVSVEVYGPSVPSGAALALLKDGATIASASYQLNDPLESGGYDLRLKDYRGASSSPRDLGQHSGPTAGLENVNFGTTGTLDDFFNTVSISPPGSGASTEQQARDALATVGISLVVIDGPGVWRGDLKDGSMAFEDTSTAEFLQATLLKTGARWWLEGNTLTIDGSAAPSSFALPSSDKHVTTNHTYTVERPEIEEPVADEPPDREDYLSQCPDYEPPEGYDPPPKTPETIMQGWFEYPPREVEINGEIVTFFRRNLYNRRLLKSEVVEVGSVNTPAGVVQKERLKSVTEFSYHAMCKEAVIKQVETTMVAPSLSSAGDNTDVELATAIWNALGGQNMYLASETVKETEYHSSGYLKEEIEQIREIEVLSYKSSTAQDAVDDFEIVYNTRTRQIINEPNALGKWVQYTIERQTENLVVYEKSAPATEGGKETASPASIQRNSRATSRCDPSDAAPTQLTCSPPDPEDPDAPPETAPCEDQREYEYQKALAEYSAKEAEKQAEYQSRIANIANQPKRVHSVTFGVPRPDIQLNALYGGGLVAAVNVSYQDDGVNKGGNTQLTVWERIPSGN